MKDRAPFQIAFIYYSSSTRFDSESPKCKSILVSHNDSLICRVKHQLRFRALGFGQYFSNNFTTWDAQARKLYFGFLWLCYFGLARPQVDLQKVWPLVRSGKGRPQESNCLFDFTDRDRR